MTQAARSSRSSAQAPTSPTAPAGGTREVKMTPGERWTEIVAVLADAVFARMIADYRAGRRRTQAAGPASTPEQ